MDHRNTFDKACFRCSALIESSRSSIRTKLLRMRGAHIGVGTLLPHVKIDWPHQISFGKNCTLEADLWFKHNDCFGLGPSITIGDRVFIGARCEFNIKTTLHIGTDSMIAAGCRFTDVHHGIQDLDIPMNRQPCTGEPIHIGENVWIGIGVIVLKGVTVGAGAVIGAGAVVTKSIPSGEIWGGVPAKRIGQRVSMNQNAEYMRPEGAEVSL